MLYAFSYFRQPSDWNKKARPEWKQTKLFAANTKKNNMKSKPSDTYRQTETIFIKRIFLRLFLYFSTLLLFFIYEKLKQTMMECGGDNEYKSTHTEQWK